MCEEIVKEHYDIKNLVDEIVYFSHYYKTNDITGNDILYILKNNFVKTNGKP